VAGPFGKPGNSRQATNTWKHEEGLLLLAERNDEHILKENAKRVDTSKKKSSEITQEIKKQKTSNFFKSRQRKKIIQNSLFY
jgi:hypothetical protein